MHYYIGPIQIYSGAEVSHTNRCQSVRRTLRHQCGSVRTLRHYNLVPKCPGAEVSRERPLGQVCSKHAYIKFYKYRSLEVPHVRVLENIALRTNAPLLSFVIYSHSVHLLGIDHNFSYSQ